MEILYKGFEGSNADPILGWFLIILGSILCISSILCVINNIEGEVLLAVIGTIFFILGFVAKADHRVPIVKATINETVSWQEINDKYKLREQTGKIYTFEVKDTTIEEWESLIKEENK